MRSLSILCMFVAILGVSAQSSDPIVVVPYELPQTTDSFEVRLEKARMLRQKYENRRVIMQGRFHHSQLHFETGVHTFHFRNAYASPSGPIEYGFTVSTKKASVPISRDKLFALEGKAVVTPDDSLDLVDIRILQVQDAPR